MANINKKGMRRELWSMLTDKAKMEVQPLKKAYLNSLMSDIESYANGKILGLLKEIYGCNAVESIEEKGTKLILSFVKGEPMIFNKMADVFEFIETESARD